MSVHDGKRIWVILLLIVFVVMAKGQEENAAPISGLSDNEILVRFKSVSGGPRRLRARTVSGAPVKIGNWYERVDNQILQELKRNGSAAYWYEIVPTSQGKHYVVCARTIKNALGVTGSFLFYDDFKSNGDWLLDKYQNDFEGATFGLRDFSVGLLYARQLFAKNRHRLSLELAPAYRQVRHSFGARHYATSFDATDPDGLDYERIVTVDHYDEELLRHCASFQLDFRYDWYFLKYLSLFVAAGVDNLFDFTRTSDVSFGATYAGRYGEELFNIVIDENGYYDFGSFPDNRIVTNNGKAFRYSLYGTALAGLQFCVGPALSLETAFVYNNLFFSNAKVDANDSFCLSESSGEYQSMAYTMKLAARCRLGVNVKLKINF